MNLTGVGRRYGRRRPWVLRGICLAVPPGALVRIDGGNGGGKSTLLRLVAGIDAPTEGRVRGRPPRTAYVPERFPVALPMTALSYLTHLGRVHGLGRAEAARRAVHWLDRFGAAGHARTPMAELSKGTSQEVAVVQALLAGPELLVLDEAWTGLDARARGELDLAVTERTAAGAAVVFVDHDPARLAGVPDAHYRVEGTGLAPVAPVVPAVTPGPRVRIRAVAAPDSVLPAGLSGRPGPDGAVVLTVDAARSDEVLRSLLGARPPWHVRTVEELP
ncbi:ATP-binding cassette domain-containing protein [Streptomyces virginiae]|uniref:ATP-binding cassette domain-containing protein n=1 Tax=Streptomyces virginiae TaxID=1961 RepID=UPI00362BDDE5